MRKWALLLILVCSAWPAMAAKSVKSLTVVQLDQLLDTLRGKPDGQVAEELSDVALTERVNPVRLARWEAGFPGSRTHEELTKLADLSAFLNPPAADLDQISVPDYEALKRMIELAAEYVKATTTRLPNFTATRETTQFEDTPSMQMAGGSAPIALGQASPAAHEQAIMISSSEYKSLRRAGSFSSTVTYRNGHELQDTDTERGKNQSKQAAGLTTGGEFGPILSVVMGDAMRGEIAWQRWEQGASEPLAVFRYAVPEEQSNYMVGVPSHDKIKRVYPGYHGEIAIDPASGAILRLSLIAKLPQPYQATQTAILVEYAPVTIGEQRYICPVRGVAVYKAPLAHATVVQPGLAFNVQMHLNDVVFTQFHLFRSEARIVTGESGRGDASAEFAPAATPSTPSPVASQVENNPEAATPATEAPLAAQPKTGSPATHQPAPVAMPSAAAAAPPQSDAPAQTTASTPLFKVTSRLTLVDVTATDSKDKPVHGLVQPEFTVNEDGKPQEIKNFEEYGAKRQAAQAASPQLPPNDYTNAQPPAPTTSAANVFMFDDVTIARTLRSAPEYFMFARLQAIKYLKTIPAGTRIAILEFAGSLRVVQNFTSDQAVLLAAMDSITFKRVGLATFIPPPALPAAPPARPGMTPLSTPPPPATNEVCSALNTQSELTVEALEGATAYLAGVQGRKNLIWFTIGIPWLTDYSRFSRIPCLRDYTAELQRDYGLLTAVQVSLYPVDPRGPATAAQDHFSMEDMAKATGGEAYYNRNDLDVAVGEAIATGADYYALSYAPPLSKYDGQYHKIDVKVDRPGVHLQYRDGYTAIDPAKLPKGAETSAEKTPAQPGDEPQTFFMNHGAAPSTEILFDVHVTPSTAFAKPDGSSVMGQPDPALKGKPLVRYDFQYYLAANQITLDNDDNGKRGASMEFIMAAYDGEGKMLNVVKQKVSFAVVMDQIAQFLQEPFQIPLRFDLPPGKIFVRVAVRDVPSGNVGTLEIPVTVDNPKQ
jgi:VWFA-related protein